MPLLRSRGFKPEPHLCHSLPPLTLLLLCSSAPLWAQDAKETATVWAPDSSRAVAAACNVVRSLRENPGEYRCYVETFKETAAEYIVRIREARPEGGLPLEFSLSEVRLHKKRNDAVLTRIVVP